MQLKFTLILLSLCATSILSHPIDGNHVHLAARDVQCDDNGYHCHHHGHHREKPFDVWAFIKGILGHTDPERPDVKTPNMGAFWGAVALHAFAPPLQARSFNSREALEARDATDDAVKFWVKFAQNELDLPSR